MATLAQPAGLPSIIEGFLNLGGKAVAVLNMSRMFGLPTAPSRLYTPLLILRSAELPIALWVDRVIAVTTLSEESVVRLGENYTPNDCADGVVIVENGVLVMLAADRILFGQERACLVELRAAAQARLDTLKETAP